MKTSVIITLLLIILLLTACGNDATEETAVTDIQIASQVQEVPGDVEKNTNHETLVDQQGAVTVAVTPLNLETTNVETVTFEVAMDTHSVDLSMDLATLATLTTENGNEVLATEWDAEMGGHHVSGILSFPAVIDGTDLLQGASEIELIIRDVDAAERVFSWQLNK